MNAARGVARGVTLRGVPPPAALLEAGDAVGAAHLMSLFLEALPVAGQVVEFFAPLAGAAAAALRGCSCVLTADGQFVLPCEALLNELQQDATASGQTTQALVQELSLSHAHPQLRLPPAVAAARTKRTGLDGGMATLRDLVLDERGAGATRLEPTDRALAAPRLAAHCKTDVAIACGDCRVTGWYDRASPSGRTESAAFHLSILSLGHFSVAKWLVLLRSPRDTSPVLQKARQFTRG